MERRSLSDLLTPGGRIFEQTHLQTMLRMHGQAREIALDLVRGNGDVLPVLLNAADCGRGVDALDRSLHQKLLLRGLRLQGFVDGSDGAAAQPPSLWLREAG